MKNILSLKYEIQNLLQYNEKLFSQHEGQNRYY